MAAAAAPPLPTEIQAQQMPQGAVAQMSAQGGPAQPNQMSREVVQELASSIGQLEELTAKIFNQISSAAPHLKALIQPIASAGKALKQEVQGMANRTEGSVGTASAGSSRAQGAPLPGSVLAAGNQGS